MASVKILKKQPLLNAIQWDGKNTDEIKDFYGPFGKFIEAADGIPEHCKIGGLSTPATLNINDWLINNGNDRFSVMNDSKFKRLYDIID